MSILDKIPNLFKPVGNKNIIFPSKRMFMKRNDIIKKITHDKTRIPKTGWAPAIRGSYLSRTKRKELAEALFPKEKFGDFVSKQKLQETMRELEQKSKTFKPSQEKFDALQKYNYLKKKVGF